MLFPSVNLLAVFLAALANMVLGFVWYSPAVMGKPWMRLMGFTAKSLKEAQTKMGGLYGLSFIGAIIQASVLGAIFKMTYVSELSSALVLGSMCWLGFIAITQLTSGIFDTKPFKPDLLAINTGYQLLSILAMSAILFLVQ